MTVMNQFFSTELSPCPYLDHRLERRLVVAVDGSAGAALHDRLVMAGFRRSQTLAYRPVCPGCSSCVPVRIPVQRFQMNRSWRRTLRQNGDLAVEERTPVATDEQFQLFRRYLGGRHADGGMTGMGWPEYRTMVEDSPEGTIVVEWRREDRSLVGVSLTDRCSSGLSGVYKFFEPEEARRSLGTLVILWHVGRAQELQLPYVYLGYWIADSPKMSYKVRFKPLERLGVGGWVPLDPDVA